LDAPRKTVNGISHWIIRCNEHLRSRLSKEVYPIGSDFSSPMNRVTIRFDPATVKDANVMQENYSAVS
jgi:hypothetical protein